MLTRLEVNGFKNLINFEMDFGPFNCIAGLNGVGKSNIFDAIKFLSLLAQYDIHSSAKAVRDMKDGGEALDIFYTDGDSRTEKISLAAEMIVPLEVTDDFSRQGESSSTYLRYELTLTMAADEYGNSRIAIEKEHLGHIPKGQAVERLKFPLSARDFRDKVIINRRKGKAFISTTSEDSVTTIHIHQDGGSHGMTQKIPAKRTPRTVVANTNSVDLPTILAAKREMESWIFLSLEPTAMRRSNSFNDPRKINEKGDFLASTLGKLIRRDSSSVDRVIRKMNRITKVTDIALDEDKTRELFTLLMKERAGAYIPARALSDGTLRFLTLSLMSEDYDFKGLLCFEEPENGIHPARIHSMLELLKEIVVDSKHEVSEENPLRQVIVATHSPILVQLQDKDDLIFADIIKVNGPFNRASTTIKCKPMQGSWRSEKGISTISLSAVIAYLATPDGAQITMDNIW
ncbi:ATP-binding protein [Pseudomonas solani]|uniref:AAA family ATPase n=1 Tax=Pseudomonas solani TaxID=2731552 RepID=UPI0035BE4EBA